SLSLHIFFSTLRRPPTSPLFPYTTLFRSVQAVVHDVKAAIAALHEYKPDVVIADYHLPDGTGADLARAVRGTLPDTSVLVLTADPSAVTLNDVARSGAVGHMTKGRGLTEVVDSVRAAASGEILFAPSELQRLLLESA